MTDAAGVKLMSISIGSASLEKGFLQMNKCSTKKAIFFLSNFSASDFPS